MRSRTVRVPGKDDFSSLREHVPAALKERNMKRTLSIWLGLLAFSLAPALAQAPAPAGPTGHIQGQVINPTGNPQGGGNINLSTDGGTTFKFTFQVDASGNYSGDAAPGTYIMIYREPTTPKGQMVDQVKAVKVVVGQTLTQNIDMSRQEYIDKMTPDQKKQLEELKGKNADALKANAVITHLNADLKVVAQDRTDIDGAPQTAAQTLGATAAKADIDAKVAEIRTAKYTDIISLMTKDTTAKPDESILWADMAFAQGGLKQYDDAITNYKKAIDLENASKKPRMEIVGVSEAGLGEIYARTGKVPDANTAYDAAAKADPTRAGLHLHNEAIIFFQQGNSAAQVAAANEAIAANPNDALAYYIKGQGLIQNATIDPKTQRIILPDDCTAAYQKYLELAPTGQFANEVAGILQQAGQKVSTSYKAPGKK
jgi:tetratricopeptide (TPR) repeat protein